jgi:hypothetical protein
VEVATILLLTGLPTPLWNEIYLFARLPTPRHVHCNVRVPTTQASLNPPCRCLSLLICGDPSPCACYCSPLHVFEVTYSGHSFHGKGEFEIIGADTRLCGRLPCRGGIEVVQTQWPQSDVQLVLWCMFYQY